MIEPRNTLVLVRLIEQNEKKVGFITVPTGSDQYTEAEVIKVGPGNVAADGGRSETFDLKPGQRVWIKHKEKRHPQMPPEVSGIKYEMNDETFYLFEQTSVLGVITEAPVDYKYEPKPKTPRLALVH